MSFNFIKNKKNYDVKTTFSYSLDFEENFVFDAIKNIYSDIFVECQNRSLNLNDKILRVLNGSFLQNEQNKGLINYLASAIASNSNLTIFYNEKDNILTNSILEKDKNKYREFNFYFSNFNTETKELAFYEKFILKAYMSISIGLNVAESIQYKMSNFRKFLTERDLDETLKEGIFEKTKKIIEGIKEGRGILIDKDDEIEIKSFDITASCKTIDEMNKKIAGVLKLPISFITGEVSNIVASNLDRDENFLYRGIYRFFTKYFKPIIDTIFFTDEKGNKIGEGIKFKKNLKLELEGCTNILNFIETTDSSILDENRKKKILENILAGF